MRVERSHVLRLSAEFIVIVAGVLVALAADRWNQGRTDAEAEDEYVARLEVEIRGDSLRGEEFLTAGPAISRADQALIGLVQGGEAPTDLVGTIVAASQELILPTPATWNDLQSTGSLALLRDPRVRRAVLVYYSAREDIALQVERSVRRGRDPFIDALYSMGLWRPRSDRDEAANCIGETCFERLRPAVFASWPDIRDLITGLESAHGAQQYHARRLIASSATALAVLTAPD